LILKNVIFQCELIILILVNYILKPFSVKDFSQF